MGDPGGGFLDKESRRMNPGGGIQEEESWRGHPGGGFQEGESWLRYAGGGVLEEEEEEESWRGALKEEAWSRNHSMIILLYIAYLTHPIRYNRYTVCIFSTLHQIQHVNYMHIKNTPSDTATILYICTASHHKYIRAQQWIQAQWRPRPGGEHVPSGDLGLAVDPAWPGSGQGLGGDLGPALGPGGDLGLVVDLGPGVDLGPAAGPSKNTTQIYNAQGSFFQMYCFLHDICICGCMERLSCFLRSAFVDAWKGSYAYVKILFFQIQYFEMAFLKLSAAYTCHPVFYMPVTGAVLLQKPSLILQSMLHCNMLWILSFPSALRRPSPGKNCKWLWGQES